MYTSQTKIRVRYAETDQMKVVYYGNYAQFFEVGRVEAFRQLGLSYKDLELTGVALPIVDLHIQFLRSAYYDDLLTITTIIKEMPVRHIITFHQEVHNEEGKLLSTGKVVGCFIDTSTKKKTNFPFLWEESLIPYFNTIP